MLGEIGAGLGGLLGQLGDALSAPRRAIWSALGAPEHGNELVSNLTGLDKDSPWAHALGLGAEVLGDPLTYAGGFIGKGIGSLTSLGRAATPTAEAAGGLGGLLLKGAEGATAAPGAIGGAAAVAESAAPSAYQAFRPLRQRFSMVRNLRPVEEAGEGSTAGARTFLSDHYAGELTGQPASRNQFLGDVDGLGGVIERVNALGAYNPKFDVGAVKSGVPDPVGVFRHEMTHGLIDQAMKTGDASGLPLVMRVPASLRQSQSGFVRGLGRIADETAANALERRDLLGQIGNGARFLMNPSPLYTRQFADESLLAAALYSHGADASRALGAGALAAGVGGAAYPFFRE